MEQYQLANRVRYHAPSISFYRNGASCETIFFKQFVILYLIFNKLSFLFKRELT